MKSKPCSCFLTYNFGKTLCENEIIKIVCSLLFLCNARLLIEIRAAVRWLFCCVEKLICCLWNAFSSDFLLFGICLWCIFRLRMLPILSGNTCQPFSEDWRCISTVKFLYYYNDKFHLRAESPALFRSEIICPMHISFLTDWIVYLTAFNHT